MHSSKVRTLIATSFVVFCTVLAHAFGWLRPLENGLRALLNPVSKAVYMAGTDIDPAREFSSEDELAREYARLRDAYRAEIVDASELEGLRKENKELRAQLGFFEKTMFTHVGAEVIGKNFELHSNTVVLNRGEDDGIRLGNPVIVGNGIMVGKIKRVEKRTSVVQLLNDQESKIAALVLNEEESPGIILGGYKISVRMNFIPQNENVQIGDSVVTSGLEDEVPKGLLIGKIEAVIKEAYQPFQEAIIVPTYPLEKLTAVSVLIRAK